MWWSYVRGGYANNPHEVEARHAGAAASEPMDPAALIALARHARRSRPSARSRHAPGAPASCSCPHARGRDRDDRVDRRGRSRSPRATTLAFIPATAAVPAPPRALPEIRPTPATAIHLDPDTGELAAPLGTIDHLAEITLALAQGLRRPDRRDRRVRNARPEPADHVRRARGRARRAAGRRRPVRAVSRPDRVPRAVGARPSARLPQSLIEHQRARVVARGVVERPAAVRPRPQTFSTVPRRSVPAMIASRRPTVPRALEPRTRRFEAHRDRSAELDRLPLEQRSAADRGTPAPPPHRPRRPDRARQATRPSAPRDRAC